MMILKGILWMIAALAGMAALCGYRIWMDKKAPTDEYDERQKIEQGKASNVSLMTGMIYFLVVMILAELELAPAPVAFLIFVGMLLELMMYHIYCLMTHAALPLSRKPRAIIGSYVTLGVVWFLRTCMYDPALGRDLNGPGRSFWSFAMVSFCFFALAAMHLISHLRDKRE